MELDELPSIDGAGRFAMACNPRPKNWPWATPSYLALNVWSSPGPFVSGVHASRDGTLAVREEFRDDLQSTELIERWKGKYAVVEVSGPLPSQVIEKEVERKFRALPIRFLTRAGQIVQTNKDVQMLDDWPETFKIKHARDLGVISAFIFENAVSRGLQERAAQFRDCFHVTMPGTETLTMYRDALGFAVGELRSGLDGTAQRALDNAVRVVRNRLGNVDAKKRYDHRD